jgi:hypothetical protein
MSGSVKVAVAVKVGVRDLGLELLKLFLLLESSFLLGLFTI